ncbi:MAG: hypothetical protein ACI8W8_002307, partial [Rhodothermales bacterium]
MRDLFHLEALEPRLLLSAADPVAVLSDFSAPTAQIEVPEAPVPTGDAIFGELTDIVAAQQIVLHFDGADDVDYNGPISLDGLAIPAFSPPELDQVGRQALIERVLDELNSRFANRDLQFSIDPFAAPASAIYIGGDGGEFRAYGDYFSLAEQVDEGNQSPTDKAFVFSDRLESLSVASGQYEDALVELIAHEVGHLIGDTHAHETLLDRHDPLSEVAFASFNASLFDPHNKFSVPGFLDSSTYNVHQQIIREALWFIAEETHGRFLTAMFGVETIDSGTDAAHFDNSNFSGTANFINAEYFALLDDLGNWSDVAGHFSRLLHPAQDFYSHSNWVDQGFRTLIDSGTGPWNALQPFTELHGEGDGAFIVQGAPPAGYTAELISSDSFEVAVTFPVLPDGSERTVKGIISGSFGDDSTPLLPVSHGQLAKDSPWHIPPERQPLFYTAYELAVAQTRHEFTRMIDMVHTASPAQAAALREAWLARLPNGDVDPVAAAAYDNLASSINQSAEIANTWTLKNALESGSITGVTVLTHDVAGSVNMVIDDVAESAPDGDALMPMAQQILQRESGWLVDYDVPDVASFGVITVSRFLDSDSTSSELVLLFDWAVESRELSGGFAESAGDRLFSMLIELGVVDPATGSVRAPLHFISEGYGAVVHSETVERLAAYGIPVDQLTYVDPLFQTHEDISLLSRYHGLDEASAGTGATDLPFGYDVAVWDNVGFAEVYYQTGETPISRPIPGAHNVWVNSDARTHYWALP